MALITLAEAKYILRVEGTDEDADITDMLTSASEIIVNFLKTDEAAAWDETTAPDRVKAATKRLLVRLYDDREGAWGDPIDEGVRSILHRDRDPALA